MPKKPYIMEARPQRHVPRWYSPPIWIDTQICQEGAPRPNRLSFDELQRSNLWRWIEDMEVNEHHCRWIEVNEHECELGTWMNYFQELAEELCSTSGLHHCCLQRPPAHVWYSKIVYGCCAPTNGHGVYQQPWNSLELSMWPPKHTTKWNPYAPSPSHNPTTAARSTHTINFSDTLFRTRLRLRHTLKMHATLGSHAESLWNNGARSCRLFE